MTYYALKKNGQRLYANHVAELRKMIFQEIAFLENNMEMAVMIYDSKGKIVEKCYLNYGAGNRCYLFRQVSSGKHERTYRSYLPAEVELVPYLLFDRPKDIDWIEIPTLTGKQVTMTGGWL